MPIKFFPDASGDEVIVRQKAKSFADETLRPTAIEDDVKSQFRREYLTKAGALGLVGLHTPKEFGGQGLSARAYYACQEELARASVAFSVAVGVTNLTQGGLLAFGNDEQKKHWLPKLARGEWLGAFSLSEPQSGSDAAALRLAARKCEGGYRLAGSKSWCSNAGHADIYLLMARTSEDRIHGITAFILLKDTPGFKVGKQEKKLGLRASTLAELVFEDCFVPDSHVLGGEGQGFKVALSQLDAGRVSIGVSGLGVAIETLERAMAFLHLRRAEGFPLGEGASQSLADPYTFIQAVKSMAVQAAELKDRGERFTCLASQVKLLGSDIAVRVANEVLVLMGERGCTREAEVERLLRDAKALQIVEGTNQIQRAVLARELEHMTESG